MTDLFDWVEPPKYPDRPGFKEPTTSREAAKKIEPQASRLRAEALAVLRAAWPAGLTAHQVAARMGRSIMSVSPRISELRKTGDVMPVLQEGGIKPQRRPNESGCTAIVWVSRRPSE